MTLPEIYIGKNGNLNSLSNVTTMKSMLHPSRILSILIATIPSFGVAAQINPRYCAQLQQLLTWPQSVGIVGGRPSSSLYFIGLQDQHVLYLDPHEVQEVRGVQCSESPRMIQIKFNILRTRISHDLPPHLPCPLCTSYLPTPLCRR